MFRRGKKNICGYWDCDKHIPDGQFLCAEHYGAWEKGLIDRCPKCSRFKDIMYRLCLDCYFGRPVASWKPSAVIPDQKRNQRVEYSDVWIDGYLRSDRFFVYILEFDGGDLYVGYTTDLTERLSDYRNQKAASPSGGHSQLQYVQIVGTKEAAELRETELEKLIKSNPSQIQLMIADFRGHMREFGCE